MYDLFAISTPDLAAVISAVAAVGVFLGGLLGWILRYVLQTEKRLATIEEAIRAIQEKLDSHFEG